MSAPRHAATEKVASMPWLCPYIQSGAFPAMPLFGRMKYLTYPAQVATHLPALRGLDSIARPPRAAAARGSSVAIPSRHAAGGCLGRHLRCPIGPGAGRWWVAGGRGQGPHDTRARGPPSDRSDTGGAHDRGRHPRAARGDRVTRRPPRGRSRRMPAVSPLLSAPSPRGGAPPSRARLGVPFLGWVLTEARAALS